MNKRLGSCLVVASLFAAFVAGCAVEPCIEGADGAPAQTQMARADGTPAQTQTAHRAWTAEESNAARAAIARAYTSDPVEYWAVHGLPALARGADLRVRDGVANPNAEFADVMTAFQAERFVAACELGQVHPMICSRTMAADLPTAIGEWMLEGGELTTRGLREVLTTSFSATVLRELAPGGAKVPGELPPIEDVVCTVPQAPEDAADSGVLTWSKVSSTDGLKGDKPDGKCVTKAVGICAQRLGLHGATVTPEAWQELSQEVGANPTGGGSIAGMKGYFEKNGYGFSEAWDGPRESATTEAQKALARGCDVFLWYRSGEASTHIEVVTGMDTTSRPDGEAVVTTNSWGERATTKVTSGTYSEKSDVSRYGAGFSPSAKATFYYACAK